MGTCLLRGAATFWGANDSILPPCTAPQDELVRHATRALNLKSHEVQGPPDGQPTIVRCFTIGETGTALALPVFGMCKPKPQAKGRWSLDVLVSVAAVQAAASGAMAADLKAFLQQLKHKKGKLSMAAICAQLLGDGCTLATLQGSCPEGAAWEQPDTQCGCGAASR